jgi:hypothetical protein
MRQPPLIYVYCIIEPDSRAFTMLERREVDGLDPREPLFPISAAGIVAAVSRVPAETFQEEPLNVLVKDLSRLAPYAVAHEHAIRTLLPAAPALIPMMFGAVYRTEERVSTLLAEQGADFRRRLDHLRDRQEWEVKVFRRPAELLSAVAASISQVNSTADAAPASPGRAYLLERLQQQRLRREAVRMTSELLGSIRERLEAVSFRVRVDPIESATSRDPELVCKIAALVARPKTGAFRALTAEMSRDYDALGLGLELSGPWAPYSFVEWDDATN